MAVSAYQLHRMVQETLQDACAAPENWMELLKTVAPFYKYDFSSALQITAQRPDATACATMRQWNRHNLWIRRGSRAIYTLDPQRPYYVQRVFDISDVNASTDRLPRIWQLRAEDHAQVFGMLREEWQGPNREDESWLKLYELVLDATEVASPDHRNAFEALRPMSALADLAPEEAENTFASLTAASAFVIATERLGIGLPEEITADILTDIQFFDTPEIQLTIGNAAHETAEAVLRQIERAVHIVDNSRLQRDNELAENNQTIPTEERMVEDGNQVAGDSVQGGRERHAGADDRVPEAAGGQRRQVRRDAQDVSDAASQGDLSADDAERDAEAAPDGRERTGAPDAGSADRPAAGDAARAGQGNEPDGLGAAHEQPEGAGGGNRPERIDLRISEEPQQIHIPVEPSNAPGSISVSDASEQLSMFGAMSFALPQEYVNRVLVEGGNGRHSAARIVAHFKKDFPIEESAAFLQREFRTGGRGVVVDGRRVSAWWDASGIRLAQGDSAQTEGAMTVSWMQAAKRIGELLNAGRFMAQDDLDMVDYLERREMAERICYAYRDDLNGIAPIWNQRVGFPEEVAQVLDLLVDRAQRDRVILQFQSDRAHADTDNPKRRRWHNMQQLEHDLLALQRPSRNYTAAAPMEAPEARFITQDEVDLELFGGNHVENGKLRIFEFYQAAHSAKEQADFLKESYGIGGHSHACGGADDAWENHDAKGVLLRRGDLSNPSAEVRLNWMQVAKRIGELIASNRYLTADELEKYKLQQEEKNRIVEIPAVPKAYDLGFGSLGNGTTVWNRLEERDGDYRTVAHISDDGNVNFYDHDMPPEVIDRIHAVVERQHEKSQTLPDPKTWIEDMVAEYGDEIVRQVQEDRGGAALHSQEELESALNRILPETLQQSADVYRAYMDDADFRRRLTEHVLERVPVEPEPPLVVEPAVEPVEQPIIAQLEADDSPEVGAAISTYAHYQQVYPQHLVFVQIGDHYETYGAAAETAHDVLNTQLLERETPDGEIVSMTGFDPASRWPSRMMKLRTAGHDVAIIGLNEQGEYELVNEGKAADLAPVGAQFEADGHSFTVDSVNFQTSRVRLKDETMFSSGYPIFREEPIEWVHEQIEAQAENRVKLQSTVLDLRPREPEPVSDHPPAGNYRIHDDHLGEGGERTKADWNLAAIQTLRQIEAENRAASEEEQEILAQYVGWGGIPQIFDESNTDWKERHDRLKSLLTDDEYASARASTLNAHYTSPVVIRSIYQALENMGFRQGSILEPACGVGNFFGTLPESMAGSRLYGVELDSLTGRIAQKLYPEAKIAVQGFEHSAFPDNYFDAAVGNVPFGAYSLADTRYDKYHFRIHDYFFAKALDKVRPGGVIAFVTSKGTLDKQDSSVRRYLAQRAELLGAIRLPNNAFLANAGTGVTTDVLFLQKRERQIDVVPEWVDVGRNEAGVPINQYFLDHPEMVLGVMAFDKSMYGNAQETTCHPIEGAVLSEQLSAAIRNIHGRYEETHMDAPAADDRLIPANPEVPNFSYAVQDGSVYYRRDSLMERQELSAADEQRMRRMIGLRDLTRELIQAQLEGASDAVVGDLQLELKERYESFSSRYGLLSDRRNAQVFREDDGYYLLTSLEIPDEEHRLQRLADMFSKRTIAQNRPIDHVDSAAEALAVSMAERAAVDLDFMSELTGMEKDKLISELKGLIYQDPGGNPAPYEKWQTADEYLSGDVRQKLRAAEAAVEFLGDRFQPNVDALRAVQPKDLEPHEIDVRLGATWIPASDISDFVHELLHTPYYLRRVIQAEYSAASGAWNISNKSRDSSNDLVNTQYGTDRRNAYRIIEDSLNLRDTRVFDTVQDAYGNEKRVLNQRETILAQQKQTAIREAFKDWIWKAPERRERLCRLYNDTYNCIRPREYDGSHLRFVGMNPELKLRPHQKNAVARILYGGNALLAHCVGAGKTAIMISSIMEKIRIGLGHKALLAVPNHLTEQTAAEFLRFYPGAKILVATRRDFETKNRKRFMGRIATGDYDAIIMGHSQFEKIPVSKERQRIMLEEQIQEIMDGIQEIKHARGERFTIKELERTKKSLEARLKKLNDDSDKDNVITFEELGVDMLYVDEAHGYKNLAVVTKMRNVAGINTMEAKKSSDMYMKTRYLSDLTGNRGVVFATGTPISNSMTELYTMQRYLQQSTLKRHGLSHFDSWAANFGETVTAIELAPEGTGYRMKTRFSKFFNLPELMSMFKQIADIQTPDMLNLPVPTLKGGKTQNIRTEASEYQKQMVAALGERADAVRSGSVDPREDNMLKITNDGRLLALDARLIDPTLPDDPNSKVNTCVREVLRIYEEGTPQKLTQMIFCDLSTPRAERTDGGFDDVYHDLRRKLIRGGVPEGEIAFIHDANTEAKKDELFARVRSGAVRILIGSTAKMGAGTNVQTRLKALHHLDCPWRPSDLQQRDGRILRQGNTNPEVEVIRYITQDTFDAYSYQLVENKQKFIAQVCTSKSPARGAEDLDEMALSYAEVKALAAGNPAIREKMDLDVQVSRLKLLKSNWQSERYRLERRVGVELPGEIARLETRISNMESDIQLYNDHRPSDAEGFSIVLMDSSFDKRADAGERLMKLLSLVHIGDSMKAGTYCGFTLRLSKPDMLSNPRVEIQGGNSYYVELGESPLGNIQRIENAVEGIVQAKEKDERSLSTARGNLADAKAELDKPWPLEQELQEKSARLTALNIELDVGGSDTGAAALADDEDEPEPSRNRRGRDAER